MAGSISITGLVGCWPCGVQPLWPKAAANAGDFFDTPWWDRPAPTNPTGGTGGGGEPDLGDSPGFEGRGPIEAYVEASAGPGFEGSIQIGWTPGDPDDPTDGGTYNGLPQSIAIKAHRRKLYRLEVYDADGDRLAEIDTYFDPKMKLRIDEASVLEFRIPHNHSASALMIRPNMVYVRDRWGFLIETFQIQETRGVRQGDATYKDIVCQSAIAQLGEEPVATYEAEATTVSAHVGTLLETQRRNNALTLGDIDDAIALESLAFRAQDTTILGALLELRSSLPKATAGHLWVDANRRVNWTLTLGAQDEGVLHVGGILQGVDYTLDWSKLVNQIEIYGEGQDPETRLSLTDAGEANAYIEDATSVASYGLAPKLKIDRRIKSPETLLRVARRILDEFAEPHVEVGLRAIDLAKSDEFAADFQDVTIGRNYRVIDSDQGIETTVEVVGMEIDLNNPLELRLELTNQNKRLGDVIGRLIDGLTQPLDVLGDRYPNMGRNLSDGAVPDTLRAGDFRWNDAEERGEVYDGANWQPMGGGWAPFRAASVEALESSYPAADQDPDALAVITGGDEVGAWYEISADGENWQGRTIWKVV